MNRETILDEIAGRSDPFDFIIVGGGATGLGAAVDAAARGHGVALLERHDFAKGTSSRSTKLVHGGVRYLQQGNVPLVLEALKERGFLYQNAPHLVHNLAFVIPTYKWWQGPFYGIGMKVYDRMAGKQGLRPSEVLTREETLRAIPTVERKDLLRGVRYYDGQFDDARLAINLARTAADLGGLPVNYVKVVSLIKESGRVAGVLARDELTGMEFDIRGRVVINATGVFVDAIRRLDRPDSENIVTPSQGVHLVLPREFLPGDSAIMIPKTSDGRVLFAVPWHGHVVVGTTDTPLAEAVLEPRALAEEKEFLLSESGKYLCRPPQPGDVRSVFAGLRPLVRTSGVRATKALSRDHTILTGDSGLITITGGKWTTYRKMAQEVIDRAEVVAGLQHRPCVTESLRIRGWTRDSIADDDLAVYGADAAAVRELGRTNPRLGEAILSGQPFTRAQVVWAVREEMACTVEDVLARRTRALLLDAEGSKRAAEPVARVMAHELGHDDAWIAENVRHYLDLVEGYRF